MRDFRAILTSYGWLLAGLAVIAALHAAASAAIGDGQAGPFVVTALAAGFFGGVAILSGRGDMQEINFRQAIMITAGAWYILPAFAAIPLSLGAWDLSVVDAYFEAVSGLTTTGSTVLSGLDNSPSSLLFWRATLQWVGGIGIIGLSIAILPFLKVGGMQLFRTESSDRSEEKLIARPSQLAAAIGSIYLGLTLLCALGYGMGGMTTFQAVAHAFTTVSTGGYSTSDASMAAFSAFSQWNAILFMIAGALPFLAYVRLLRGRASASRGFTEIALLLGLLLAAAILLTAYQTGQGADFWRAARHAAFNVVSVVTTTGYASLDYQLWGTFAVVAFFMLTFVGGCAGSTSGGFKIFRFEVMAKGIAQSLTRTAMPHAMAPMRHRGRLLSDTDIASVALFAGMFVATFALGALILAATGLDFITAISGSATALTNVGPGLGDIIGPAGNFASLPDAAKWTLCVIMVLGRLEIVTVLILFTPRFHAA